MKKATSLLLFLLASVVSLAQDKPTAEITGAYQFTRLYGVNVPLGWDASVNIPANDWVGVVGDFGGATKSESGVTATLLTYGGGPQITLRTRSVQPYFRVVLGAAHVSESGYGFSGGTTAFLVAPGGGADFRISDRVWLRLGANYPLATKNGATVDGIQAIAGITYRFGGTREVTRTTEHAPSLNERTVPLLGITVDSKMSIIRLFPDSVLAGHLEPGDVINSVDGKDVRSPEELTSATASLTKGTKVKIGYLVHGQWQTWIYVQL